MRIRYGLGVDFLALLGGRDERTEWVGLVNSRISLGTLNRAFTFLRLKALSAAIADVQRRLKSGSKLTD